MVYEEGWNVLNGKTAGDWDGEFTYVGTRGNTKSVVRTSIGYMDSFITRKDVRQGCALSPLLFNIYIADLDK